MASQTLPQTLRGYLAFRRWVRYYGNIMTKSLAIAAIAAVSFVLGACGQPYNPPPAPASAFTADAIHCYRTLARNDCYDRPQLGQDYRYAGGYPK